MAYGPHQNERAQAARRCGRILNLLLIVALFAAAPRAVADDASGDSSRESRSQAIRALPLRELPPEYRDEVLRVVKEAALFRRLPTRVIDCDPRLFGLMAERPDVMVDVWRVLSISKLRLWRVADDQYKMTDATGTTGDVRVLYTDQLPNGDRRLVAVAQGVYDAPPMPRSVKATTLFLFHWRPFVETNGRSYVQARLDAFVHVDRPTAELIVRAVQPLATRTADHNFVETMRFMSLFSHTAQRNPEGIARLADNLNGVDPATRVRLANLCGDIAGRPTAIRPRRADLQTVQAVASDAPRPVNRAANIRRR